MYFVLAYEELINARLIQKNYEKNIGLSQFSYTEIDVFIALVDLINRSESAKVRTNELVDHELLQRVSRATIFRTLKKLELAKMIQKTGIRSGYYTIFLSE